MRDLLRRIIIFGIVVLWGGALRAGDPGKATLRRLSVEAVQWRGLYGAGLAAGLKEDAHAITPPELDLMTRLARSPGVASVVYLNGYGQVRWSEDPELIMFPLEEYQKKTGARDPKCGAVASLYNILTDERLNHQVEVTEGVLREECGEIMSRFFQQKRIVTASTEY